MNRLKSNAQIEREALEGFVVEKVGLHKGRHGYRRINRELRRDGIAVSEKRVLTVMRRLASRLRARRESTGERSRSRRAIRA